MPRGLYHSTIACQKYHQILIGGHILPAEMSASWGGVKYVIVVYRSLADLHHHPPWLKFC